MDCEQAQPLMSALIDREIAADDRARLEGHLHECAACACALDALQGQDADLRRAYDSCSQSAAVVAERAIAEVRADAAPAATKTPAAATPHHRLRPYFGWALAAAILLGVGFGLLRQGNRPNTPVGPGPADDGFGLALTDISYLTARRLPDAPAAQPLQIGQELRTAGVERRRVTLPDGSIVYLNANTTVRLDADRRLQVEAGEVFVEVAPRNLVASGGRKSPGAEPTFVVRTAQREVKALGTKFAVKVSPIGTSVVVTQGKVEVNGIAGLLNAGQQLKADSSQPDAAPRASYVLDWLRELVAAAESPLVPRSQHQGGALIAVDPWGQEAKLSLRNYHVDVHIEDGFARTTIDQTYFNHNAWRMEGTFYFPLPPDASLSRLAMYVADGKVCNLMEGGMAERDYARNVFEQIVTSQKDPALLEWLDGSTFKMRVFPLEGRQEKRIVMSYTQRLDSLYSRQAYRFPGGHNLPLVNQWSANLRVKNGADMAWSCPSYPMQKETDGADLVLKTSAKNVKPDRDLALELVDNLGGSDRHIRFSTTTHEDARYLMLRYRPQLTSPRQVQRRDWVFLFETSGDRDPLLARTQIEILRTLLNHAGHDDTFAIVRAGSRIGSLEPRQVTPDNVKAGLEYLEKAHLIGALDLGNALNTAVKLTKDAVNPTIVHVGSGIAALGDRNENELAKRVPENVPYVGVGVGKRWNRSWMKNVADRTGGAFTQINPDESIVWRSFELFSLVNTPRLMNVKVVDNAEQAKFLTFATTCAQGEEICAIARLEGDKAPQLITIDATLEGKPFRTTLPVADVADKATYLPRAWARLEIDRLLAENREGNKSTIVELSKKMYVMSPFTSLLVLENDKMYEQFKVDRGRKDHWAMYPCPATIPTIYEPDPAQGIDVRFAPKDAGIAQKPTAEQVLDTILVRVPPRCFGSAAGQQALTVTQLLSNNIGLGDIETNYNIDRIEELSVPGPVNPNQAVGLLNGKTGRPTFTLPANNGMPFNNFFAAPLVDGFGGIPGGMGGWNPNLMFLGGGAAPAAEADMRAPADPVARILDRTLLGIRRGQGQFPRDRDLANDEIGNDPDLPRLDLLAGRLRADMYRRGRFDDLSKESEKLKKIEDRIFKRRDGGIAVDFSESMVAGEDVLQRLMTGLNGRSLVYQRPAFSNDERLFYDLVSYAPGMNTSRADIFALVDAESRPDAKDAPGKVDPAAAKLIDAARASGWHTVRIPASGKQSAYTVTFDGAGRFVTSRVTSDGLRERVVCDGKTLWHLYPELGIGAKRTFSYFHHADFAALVPWALPAVADLARGNNISLSGADTVRITPRDSDGKKSTVAVELVFADGRLVERRAVELPGDKVLYKETYTAAGRVQLAGSNGKVVSDIDLAAKAVEKSPSMEPDTKSLVVLPLPYRTEQAVNQLYPVPEESEEKDPAAHEERYLARCATYLLQNPAQAFHEANNRAALKDDKSIGYTTLLLSSGLTVDTAKNNGVVLLGKSTEPVARYLKVVAAHGNRWQERAGDIGAPSGSFLRRLADFREHVYDWQRQDLQYANKDKAIAAAIDYARANKDSVRGWIVLERVRGRVGDQDARLIPAYALFADHPGLGYYARYEQARLLLNDGKAEAARKLFLDLYRETTAAGGLPPLDGAFRQALQQEGKDLAAWPDLVRQTAHGFIGRRQRAAVILLAGQCRNLDDTLLAEELVALALKNAPEAERLGTTLAAIEHYVQHNQFKRAEKLLDEVLQDDKHAQNANLWFLAASLAGRQKATMRSVVFLDKALELEYRNLPEAINVQQLRYEYGQLLGLYQQVIAAMDLVQMELPKELAGKVVRAADRWRSLDPDPTQACQMAAAILKQLGATDLAWDYLTTPSALKPNEADGHLTLAAGLAADGSYDLADRAFQAAFDAESTNPEILMQRAQNLTAAGKTEHARKVYRQVAEGSWQPRFQWIKQQAQYQLGAR